MSLTKRVSFTALIAAVLLVCTHLLVSTLLAAQDAPPLRSILNQPVTISQNQYGFNLYAVDGASGKPLKVLHIDMDVIESSDVPATTYLLADSPNPFTGEMISVYRLSTGEFQLETRDSNDQLFSVRWNEHGTITRNPVS